MNSNSVRNPVRSFCGIPANNITPGITQNRPNDQIKSKLRHVIASTGPLQMAMHRNSVTGTHAFLADVFMYLSSRLATHHFQEFASRVDSTILIW